MTSTSSFGVSARESHDSIAFRRLRINDGMSRDPNSVGVKEDVSGDWYDRLYCGSSAEMVDIPSNTVGLAFTSPPYSVGKSYDEDLSLEEWQYLMSAVAAEVWRVLVPGGRYVINVANIGRKPYIPLTCAVHEVMSGWHDFMCQGEIIWKKAKGAGGNCAWGSWQSSRSPSLRDIHEYLIVFTKGMFGRPDKGDSTIGREEFMGSTLSVWEIPPESAKRIGHPAPFPVALAERVINLYSYAGDVVLDPFMGSGTTCIAARNLGRKYVGYDTSQEYVELAEGRME